LVSTVEQIVSRIAGRQHGVVTWAEMLAAGVSAREIRHRIKIGLLVRVHRGVYSVGHRPLTTEARYLAAVKACGPGAALCGRAAAYLLGILKVAVPPPPEVATRNHRRIPGLTTRRLALDNRDVTAVKAVPCTTVPRTVVDLAGEMDDDPFARLCHEAGVRYGTTPRHVKVVMNRQGWTKGAARIRRVMEGDTKVALSVLEHGFLDTLKAEGFPLPDTNKKVDNRRVDCRWTDPPVTIELVSFKYHNSRHAWESDHDREREARSRGDEWRSFTYKDVFEDQTYMLGELRKLLGVR
jgi:hypothetical protein